MSITKLKEKKPTEPKRWIFKSNHDFKLKIRGGIIDVRRGPSGTKYDHFISPIYVSFNNGTFEINEHVAKSLGYPAEDIAQLMMDSPFINKRFRLIWAPDQEPDAAMLKYSKEADAQAVDRQVKVRTGDRATGNTGK